MNTYASTRIGLIKEQFTQDVAVSPGLSLNSDNKLNDRLNFIFLNEHWRI